MTSNYPTDSQSENIPAQASLLQQVLKNFWPLVILLLIAGACFGIIQIFKKPGQMSVLESQAMDMSAMVPPKGALPVAISCVSREAIAGSVTYTGSAVAFEDEDVFPRIEGRIAQMPVYPGDRVRQGQLLVQLDPPKDSEYLSRFNEAKYEAQASEHDAAVAKEEFKKNEFQLKAAEAAEKAARSAVDTAQANLDYWTPELKREADLLKKQVISQQEYDNEEAQHKEAQSKLAGAQAQLVQAANTKLAAQSALEVTMHHVGHRFAVSKEAEAREKSAQIIDSYRRIVASANGVVTKRVVSPGVVVSPGMLILKVAHVNRMRLQAELANTDVDKIHVGAPVFYKSSDNGAEHKAFVTSIFPAADPTSRTFIVEALIDNTQTSRARQRVPEDGNLPSLDPFLFLPGQYVVMRIVTGQAEGLVIPSKAIVWKEGKAMVWKAVGGGGAKGSEYTCMMHPEVQSDKAGKCPKCGMELVAKELQGGTLSAQLVEIKTGIAGDEKTEVVSGLNEGEQVIYEGMEDLQPGMAVVATDWGKSGPAKLPMASDITSNRLSSANNWTAKRELDDLAVQVSMSPSPPKSGTNALMLQLEQKGKPVSGASISGTSNMPTMGAMAGPELHTSEKTPGRYEVGCNFSSGLWQAVLDMKLSGGGSKQLTIDIEVP